MEDDTYVKNLSDVGAMTLIDTLDKHLGFVHGVLGLVNDHFGSDDCDISYPAGWVIDEAEDRIKDIEVFLDEIGRRLGRAEYPKKAKEA